MKLVKSFMLIVLSVSFFGCATNTMNKDKDVDQWTQALQKNKAAAMKIQNRKKHATRRMMN